MSGKPSPAAALPAEVDAIILGRDLLSAACAYAFATAGLRVLVLGVDEQELAPRHVAPLAYSQLPVGSYARLGACSRVLWRQWESDAAARRGASLTLRRSPALVVVSDRELRAARRRLAGTSSVGRGVPLGPRSLTSVEPGLCAHAGVLRHPGDEAVEVRTAAAVLLDLAVGYGAVVALEESAARLETSGGVVQAVRSASGQRVAVSAVVNTACANAAVQGEGWTRASRISFSASGHARGPATVHWRGDDNSWPVTLTGQDDGTVRVTGPATSGGFLEQLAGAASGAVAALPALADAAPTRPFQMVEFQSPDGMPLIGADAHLGGVWQLCGFGGFAATCAPAGAELLVQLATGQSPAIDVADFAPTRFWEAA